MFGSSSEAVSQALVKDIARLVLVQGANVLITAKPGSGHHTVIDHLSAALRARGIAAGALPMLSLNPAANPYRYVPRGCKLDVYCGALENPWVLQNFNRPKQFLMWHDPRFELSPAASSLLSKMGNLHSITLSSKNCPPLPTTPFQVDNLVLTNSDEDAMVINNTRLFEMGDGIVSKEHYVHNFPIDTTSSFLISLGHPPHPDVIQTAFNVEVATVRPLYTDSEEVTFLLSVSNTINGNIPITKERVSRYFKREVSVVPNSGLVKASPPYFSRGSPAFLWGTELCEIHDYSNFSHRQVEVVTAQGPKGVLFEETTNSFPLEPAFATSVRKYFTTDTRWSAFIESQVNKNNSIDTRSLIV